MKQRLFLSLILSFSLSFAMGQKLEADWTFDSNTKNILLSLKNDTNETWLLCTRNELSKFKGTILNVIYKDAQGDTLNVFNGHLCIIATAKTPWAIDPYKTHFYEIQLMRWFRLRSDLVDTIDVYLDIEGINIKREYYRDKVYKQHKWKNE